MRNLPILVILLACASFAQANPHDPKQRRVFVKSHPCPATVAHSKRACPGYVVDHIVPLACGGTDTPSNMQWQDVSSAKAKDKVERKGCKK